MACVASTSSIWSATTATTPLRPWNTTVLSISIPQQQQSQKPRLRLPISNNEQMPPARRFDPFADESSSSSSLPYLQQQQETQNTPAAPAVVGPAPRGRRRSPSFSAGSGSTRSSLQPSLLSSPNALSITYGAGFAGTSTPSPAPSLTRPSLPSTRASSTTPAVPLAPSAFHARHYPTSDARARLLARTLLNRINVVGRPRSPYSSSYSSSCYGGCADGYESECGRRAYVPSRLSECVVAAC